MVEPAPSIAKPAAPAATETTVVDLRHGQKDVRLKLIALELVDSAMAQQEPVLTWLVADGTGSIHLSVFGERARAVRAADILLLEGG